MKIAKDEKTRQTLLKTTEKRRKIDEKMTMKIDEENWRKKWRKNGEEKIDEKIDEILRFVLTKFFFDKI